MSNKKLGIIIWGLCFALAMVLMFCLERGLTTTFWVTLGFVCVAFLSALVFQMLVWKTSSKLDKQVLHFSGILLSNIYALIQLPICIIFSLGSNSIPFKASIIINAIILIVAWVLILASLVGNDHIERVNSRQKDHHVEL
jgi:hypothetical protein